MKTRHRLTVAYESARVLEFDETSKFVLFSDAHRGDGSRADEFSKNQVIFAHALNHYYARGFTLVEAGDQDDLWEFPHIRHIAKAHTDVYTKLGQYFEQDWYIRLFGNHDAQLADPRFVRRNLAAIPDRARGSQRPLLSGISVEEALLLRHKWTSQEILVVHGHQGDLSNDHLWCVTMWMYRLLWKWMHAFGISSPTSPIRNGYKRHKVERAYRTWIRDAGLMLICGHTHRERFARPDETPYFNTGACMFNGYITGIEIADDEICLVRWAVRADEDGVLRVVRCVLAGPTPLEVYDRTRFPGLTICEEKRRHEEIRKSSRAVANRFGVR